MKLSSHGLKLAISPRSRCTEEGWCEVHVEVSVPGFDGSFDAQLQGDDFSRFSVELGRLHAAVGQPGTATLSSHEPGLEIVLAMQPLGAIAGLYRLESYRAEHKPTVLSGSFDVDQSFLPSLQSGVLQLLAELGGENEA